MIRTDENPNCFFYNASMRFAHATDVSHFISQSCTILRTAIFYAVVQLRVALLIRDGQEGDIGQKRYHYSNESTQVADLDKEKTPRFRLRHSRGFTRYRANYFKKAIFFNRYVYLEFGIA